jgi:hypothetical protein
LTDPTHIDHKARAEEAFSLADETNDPEYRMIALTRAVYHAVMANYELTAAIAARLDNNPLH